MSESMVSNGKKDNGLLKLREMPGAENGYSKVFLRRIVS